MGPRELAEALKEELADALADTEGGAAPPAVEAVEPPQEIRADAVFHVIVRAAGGAALRVDLPANLAVSYLADEEAAVDEWRRWVRDLLQRIEG
jgi:hypothetical protein